MGTTSYDDVVVAFASASAVHPGRTINFTEDS